jgi:hypothetical protein
MKQIMRHALLPPESEIYCDCFDKCLRQRIIKSLISNHTFLSDLERNLNWLKSRDEFQNAKNIDLKRMNFTHLSCTPSPPPTESFTQFVVKQFRYISHRILHI